MKKFPELDLILMDGRRHSIYTIVEELRQLPENTVILVGTWRVDMNEGYFMRNATYAMMEATPTIPAFTPSSVSLGYWAIGGVLPDYRKVGGEMAMESIRMDQHPEDTGKHLSIIGSKAVLATGFIGVRAVYSICLIPGIKMGCSVQGYIAKKRCMI